MKKKHNQTKGFNFKLIGFNSILFLLILYFAFHSLSGDRGLFAFIRLSHEVDSKREKLDQLVKKRMQLEHKVKLLHPRTLDKDMLGELARKDLGLTAKGEKVIILK